MNVFVQALKGPILVTGASGFIGANLFKKIVAVRPDVFAVEFRSKSWRLLDANGDNVVAVDLTDQAAAKNLVDTVGPQTIFDCAAYGAYSFEENTRAIYQTNVFAIVNLVELLAERNCCAYIHAGTSSEYGTNCSAPSEDSACEPNSYYAVSKLAAAEYLRYMGKQRQFPCVNLRLYSVYGPLEDTSRLIPNMLRSAASGGLPPLVDAEISRDFVHVDDVCDAFVLAAAKMHPGLYGEAVNIGTGVKTTIRELAGIVRRLYGIPTEPIFGAMKKRDWDLPDWYADRRKAKELLDWEPTTALEDGLRSTAAWVTSLSEAEFLNTANKAVAKRRRSVSAIVACYKDAEAMPDMYRRLTETFGRLGIDYEIIFVNDCSPDSSAEVIRELSSHDGRVIGISHSRNFGSQMAFRSGMELATKDAVVLLDGDLQDPPELIEQFVQKWEEGFDVVYGRRVKRDMPFLDGLFRKIFYRVFAAFSYIRIPLDAGDFSLMNRRVVVWLLSCPERDLFIRGLRAYVGFKQTGVDYVRPDRPFGQSTNNLFKNIDWAKRGVFSFSNTPLTMLTAIGTSCLFLSVMLAVVEVALRIFFPGIAPKGITTILIAILLFGSFNLFAVGLVGEYVAKITTEVKGRPRLIRSALIRNGEATEPSRDGKVLS